MCPTFSEDDVGKRVENADGTAIGHVVEVEDETVRVEQKPRDPDLSGTTLEAGTDDDDSVTLAKESVTDVTDTVIRLRTRSAAGAAEEGGGDGRSGADELDRTERDENHLERAREQLRRASDDADRPTQEHLDSLQTGVFEEIDGDLTQEDPDPKADRIAEVAEKLDGLAEETSGEIRDRIQRGRDHLRDYLDAN